MRLYWNDWETIRRGKRPSLLLPMIPEPRTAVLMPGFEEDDYVRTFENGWCREARAFQPEAIAAPAATLLHLARAVRRGEMRAIPLRRALIAFTGSRLGALDEAALDTLWRAFEVPVFEQVLDRRGNLLAWECEVHDGLHVTGRRALHELVSGETGATIELAMCGCGAPGPRLVRAARPASLAAAACSGA